MSTPNFTSGSSWKPTELWVTSSKESVSLIGSPSTPPASKALGDLMSGLYYERFVLIVSPLLSVLLINASAPLSCLVNCYFMLIRVLVWERPTFGIDWVLPPLICLSARD